jgi:hypothetical protein
MKDFIVQWKLHDQSGVEAKSLVVGTGRPASLEHPENNKTVLVQANKKSLLSQQPAQYTAMYVPAECICWRLWNNMLREDFTITSLTGFDPDVASRR